MFHVLIGGAGSCHTINSNNLDNPHQSALENGHSTETAFLHFKNEIHPSLSCGEPTALVLLDLSAAIVPKRFISYLSHPFQALKIGSTVSELRGLLFGVPESSVLGPLLLFLDTTPFSMAIGKHPKIKFYFYAENTQLFVHMSHKKAA